MRRSQQRTEASPFPAEVGDQPFQPSPARPYLTSQQAVAYLSLGSLSALYRAIREQGLPFCRIGSGAYRFDYRELDGWLREHRTGLTVVRKGA